MSDALVIGLATVLASIFSIAITQGVAFWINKRKAPAEIRKLDSEGRLTNGNLTEKYQEIAAKQADENIELGSQLKNEREENKKLARAYDELRMELKTMEQRHDEEIQDLKSSFEKERKENEKIRDWARRLVMQIQSLGFVPVPCDVEEAKKLGISMGDMGSYSKK